MWFKTCTLLIKDLNIISTNVSIICKMMSTAYLREILHTYMI